MDMVQVFRMRRLCQIPNDTGLFMHKSIIGLAGQPLLLFSQPADSGRSPSIRFSGIFNHLLLGGLLLGSYFDPGEESGEPTAADGEENQQGSLSPESGEQHLEAIFRVVKEKTGHDSSSYKKSTVERRMTVNGLDSRQSYLVLLEESQLEAHALYQEMLIGVRRSLIQLLPTIFMSGYAADVLAQQGLCQEKFSYLPKPIRSETLFEKIREVLPAREQDMLHTPFGNPT